MWGEEGRSDCEMILGVWGKILHLLWSGGCQSVHLVIIP